MKMYLRTWLDSMTHRRSGDSHLTQVRCAVYVYETGDILMVEISKERDLPEHPFRELGLLGGAIYHFDSHWLSGDFVGGRAEWHDSAYPSSTDKIPILT